jgi:HEAT repeat protein
MVSVRTFVPLCAGLLVCSAAAAGGGEALTEKTRRYWRGAREVSPGRLTCSGAAAGEVVVVCDRWPDGSDLRRFGLDAVRLSGARTEQEKCLAVWRWVRRWTMYTDGNPPTEKVLRAKRGYIDDPLKQLNVYGAHWCDGLSRVVECVWRAMGGRATKLYRGGHTMVDVFYRDEDGVARWHLLDVSEGGFTFHSSGKRLIGPDEMSTDFYLWMSSWVHCPHLRMPAHRMELDLRPGEKLVRLWGNFGKPYQDNVRRDHQTVPDFERGPYPKVDYGNGRWTYAPDLGGDGWKRGLAGPPRGLAAKGLAPAAAGKPATCTWDFRTPYIVSEARVEMQLSRRRPGDTARLQLSLDGGESWKQVWELPAEVKGSGKVTAKVCPKYKVTGKARPPEGFHSPFGRYAYRLRLQLAAAEAPERFRVEKLRFVTEVQQNFYALPQLQPGKNRIDVRGRLAAGGALKVTYEWDDPAGKKRRNVTVLEKLPASYEIVAAGRKWKDVVCRSIALEAVAATGKGNRTTVREEPAAFAKLPAMAPAARTRHRWQRPDREKLSALAQLVRQTRDPATMKRALAGLIERRDPTGFDAARRVAFEVTPAARGRLKGVKELALVAMYVSDRKRARKALLEILSDEARSAWKHDPQNPAVRGGHWAAGAAIIGYMAAESGWKEFGPGLVGALESPHCGGARVGLLRTLGRLGEKRAAPAVVKILGSKDRSKDLDLAGVAARAAGPVGARKAIPRLKQLLNCGYEPTIFAAAESLAELGEASQVETFRGWLRRSGDEDYRATGARVLGLLRDRESAPAIRAALEAESFPWVRAEMEAALKRLGGK